MHLEKSTIGQGLSASVGRKHDYSVATDGLKAGLHTENMPLHYKG
jgi:hypothetical protein